MRTLEPLARLSLPRFHARATSAILFVSASLASGGCGLKDEPQWLEARDAQLFFGNKAEQRALVDNEVADLALGCEALLPAARDVLSEPGAPGLRVLIQVCADEGLGFGNELRCMDGTLQVNCR